ncbi:MAG: peptidase S10 [Hyphomicrobiales bacterium]
MTQISRPFAGILCLGAMLGFLAASPLALADDAQAPKAETASEQSTKNVRHLRPTAITFHSIALDGQNVPYSAVAGSISLRDNRGETTAEIFYVSYAKDPEDTKRPVTFVFNGGPGAASAYLHLGAIGPKIVEANQNGELLGPPPRLIDNDASWLGFTDLVFVDPVGTGYSRAADGKDEDDFWGVEQDTEALAEFIRLYLTQNGRMSSPVFLTGESYGGFRAATITRELQKSSGISPSGLVLVSPALEFALLNGEDYDPLPWALALPSYAAVKLETEGVTGRDVLGAALKDAEHYALTDYLVALASGAEQGGKQASARVAELTGLPVDVVERHLARVSPYLFIKEFKRDGGQLLSRYDGSVSGPDPHPSSSWPRGPDPVLDSTVPLWTSAFVQYAQDELAYKTDATYRLLNRRVRDKWDFGTRPTRQGYAGVLDDIQQARAANRALEVLIATGYTDLITPYLAPTYLVNQLQPLEGAAPITVEDYAGGHMLYLRADSRRALETDVEAMYRRALASAPQG